MHRLTALTLAAALSLALAACGGSSPTDAPDTSAPDAAPVTEATEAPAPTEAPAAAPGVGVAVPVGASHVWTVASVEDRGQTIESGNQFIDNLTTAGRFLLVKATVENKGADAFYVEAPKVVDSAGREFDYNSDAIMIIDSAEQCALEQVNPGLSKGCTWIFEVPADATALRLKVAGGLLDSPVEIDLGQ